MVSILKNLSRKVKKTQFGAFLYHLIKHKEFFLFYRRGEEYYYSFINKVCFIDRIFDMNFLLLSLNQINDVVRDIYEYYYLPKCGDIIFDIGAGIGVETYFFSKAVGDKGRVISIEAHPDTFKVLEKFCIKNKLNNVTLLNLAVSDRNGEVSITNYSQYQSNTIVKEANENMKIKTFTLDKLCYDLGIKSINFLKMNIEGAEKLAIKGMLSSIDIIKNICICCHDFKAKKEGELMRTKEVIKNFLKNHNFILLLRENDKRIYVKDQVWGKNEYLI